MKKNGGFTVIELMIVLAMLVVLSALAIPSIRGLSTSTGRSRAASEIISDMALARMTAIRSGRSVAITVIPPTQYTMTYVDDGSNVEGHTTVDISDFRGGVQFTLLPPGGATPPPVATITFTPRGFAQAVPQGWGDFYLTDQANNPNEVIRLETTFAGVTNMMRYAPANDAWVYF